MREAEERRFAGALLTGALLAGSLVAGSLITTACSTSVEVGADTRPGVATSAPAVATTAASGTGPAAVNSTTTSAAPATSTTTASTTAASTSTSTSSTTTTTTTAPPPVGPIACPPNGQSIWEVRPPSDLAGPALPEGWSTEVVGVSVQGREILAHVRQVDAPRRRVLVVGGIHGNEPASPPTVRGLLDADHVVDHEVWLVPEMNPDGVAAGMRCNANGVDLNRNFSWGWRVDDGGPDVLSEPEPGALTALVERLRPDLVVWVHQPYGYVSSIGATSSAFEEAWSAGSGLPVRPDVTQHGGGESWTALAAGFPSMLIEIDTWAATPEIVAAQRAGYEATVRVLG